MVEISERYWVTGAQIGILRASGQRSRLVDKDVDKILKEIENNQFIGNMLEPYTDFVIKIVKKE